MMDRSWKESRQWLSARGAGLVAVLVLNGLAAGCADPDNEAPAGIRDPAEPVGEPYPPSQVIREVRFRDGTLRTEAPGSDNWPVTWAADDTLYTSWGDGGGFGGTNDDGRVSLGIGRVMGGRADYRGENIAGGYAAPRPAPFTGKSEGILAVGDTLFLWRAGDDSERSAFAFSRLYRSEDGGVTWSDTGVEFSRRSGDFGSDDPGFFSPTFAQFGRGHEGAPGGYAFIYAPEIADPSHWDIQKPGRIALMRVPAAELGRESAYEFFAGLGADGEPRWTSDPAGRAPVWEDERHGTHRMAVSYNPGIGRYLLTTMTVDRTGWFALYDAPRPWGPWTTVRIEQDPERWGEKVVVFNFVNKWLREDGRDFVIVYTRNDSWATIEGEFILADDPAASGAP